MSSARSLSLALRLAALGSLALLVAAGAACGDLYSDPVEGATQAPPRLPSDFAIDASPVTARDIVPRCPVERAVEGAACDSLGATCEYGSSPDQRCNTTLACGPDGVGGNAWISRPSVLCPSYECPRGPSAPIEGTPCALPAGDAGAPTDADELVCPMTDGICACSTGTDPAHAHARVWVCVKPSTSCPGTRPLVGESCGGARTCDYGSCAFKQGMRMECAGETWSSASASCN